LASWTFILSDFTANTFNQITFELSNSDIIDKNIFKKSPYNIKFKSISDLKKQIKLKIDIPTSFSIP